MRSIAASNQIVTGWILWQSGIPPIRTSRAPFVLRLRDEESTGRKPAYSQSPERDAGNAISFVSNLPSSSQAGRRRFDPGLPLQNQQLTATPKTCTLLHYIKGRHEAFCFGIRMTFWPSTESSSFLAATPSAGCCSSCTHHSCTHQVKHRCCGPADRPKPLGPPWQLGPGWRSFAASLLNPPTPGRPARAARGHDDEANCLAKAESLGSPMRKPKHPAQDQPQPSATQQANPNCAAARPSAGSHYS